MPRKKKKLKTNLKFDAIVVVGSCHYSPLLKYLGIKTTVEVLLVNDDDFGSSIKHACKSLPENTLWLIFFGVHTFANLSTFRICENEKCLNHFKVLEIGTLLDCKKNSKQIIASYRNLTKTLQSEVHKNSEVILMPPFPMRISEIRDGYSHKQLHCEKSNLQTYLATTQTIDKLKQLYAFLLEDLSNTSSSDSAQPLSSRCLDIYFKKMKSSVQKANSNNISYGIYQNWKSALQDVFSSFLIKPFKKLPLHCYIPLPFIQIFEHHPTAHSNHIEKSLSKGEFGEPSEHQIDNLSSSQKDNDHSLHKYHVVLMGKSSLVKKVSSIELKLTNFSSWDFDFPFQWSSIEGKVKALKNRFENILFVVLADASMVGKRVTYYACNNRKCNEPIMHNSLNKCLKMGNLDEVANGIKKFDTNWKFILLPLYPMNFIKVESVSSEALHDALHALCPAFAEVADGSEQDWNFAVMKSRSEWNKQVEQYFSECSFKNAYMPYINANLPILNWKEPNLLDFKDEIEAVKKWNNAFVDFLHLNFQPFLEAKAQINSLCPVQNGDSSFSPQLTTVNSSKMKSQSNPKSLPSVRSANENLRNLSILLESFNELALSINAASHSFYKKIYFILDESLYYNLRFLSCKVEFICCDIETASATKDVEFIIEKMSSFPGAAVCFLLFTSTIIKKECTNINSVKCSHKECEENIEVCLLRMPGNESFIRNRVEEINLFAKSLSEIAPTFILPLFPSVAYFCDDISPVDHSIAHLFPKIPSKNTFLAYGCKTNWNIAFATLNQYWNDLMEKNHKDHFSFSLVKKFIDSSREIAAFGSDKRDYGLFLERIALKGFIDSLYKTLVPITNEFKEIQSPTDSQPQKCQLSTKKSNDLIQENRKEIRKINESMELKVIESSSLLPPQSISSNSQNHSDPSGVYISEPNKQKNTATKTSITPKNPKCKISVVKEHEFFENRHVTPKMDSSTAQSVAKCAVDIVNENAKSHNEALLQSVSSLTASLRKDPSNSIFEKAICVVDHSLASSSIVLPYHADIIFFDFSEITKIGAAEQLIEKLQPISPRSACFLIFSLTMITKQSKIWCSNGCGVLQSTYTHLPRFHKESLISKYIEDICAVVDMVSEVLPTFILPLFPLVTFFVPSYSIAHNLVHLFEEHPFRNAIIIFGTKSTWINFFCFLKQFWGAALKQNHASYVSLSLVVKYLKFPQKINVEGFKPEDYFASWNEKEIWEAFTDGIISALVKSPSEVKAAQSALVESPSEFKAAQSALVESPSEVKAAQSALVKSPSEVKAAQKLTITNAIVSEPVSSVNSKIDKIKDHLLKSFSDITTSLNVNQKPFKSTYIIGNKALSTLISYLPFHVTFIDFDLSYATDQDADCILKKIGQYDPKTSICFLNFSSTIITQINSYTSCEEKNCNTKIELWGIKPSEEGNIVDKRIKEICLLIEKMSEKMPTFIFPLFPCTTFFYSSKMSAKHYLLHAIPKFPPKNAHLVNCNKNLWFSTFDTLSEMWNRIMEENHRDQESLPLIKKFIELSRPIGIIGTTIKEDFYGFWKEKDIWKNFIGSLLKTFVTTTTSSKCQKNSKEDVASHHKRDSKSKEDDQNSSNHHNENIDELSTKVPNTKDQEKPLEIKLNPLHHNIKPENLSVNEVNNRAVTQDSITNSLPLPFSGIKREKAVSESLSSPFIDDKSLASSSLKFSSTTKERMLLQGQNETPCVPNMKSRNHYVNLRKKIFKMSDSMKRNSKHSLIDKVFFIGNAVHANSISCLPFNIEWITFELGDSLDHVVASLTEKMGSSEFGTKACFLVFSSAILTEKSSNNDLKCSKKDCTLDIKVDLLKNEEANFIEKTLERLDQLVENLSEKIPTFILPLLPTVICFCNTGATVDHSLVHMLNNSKCICFALGNKASWNASLSELSKKWKGLIKHNHHNRHSLPLILKYADSMKDFYGISSTLKNYNCIKAPTKIWKDFVSSILNFLVKPIPITCDKSLQENLEVPSGSDINPDATTFCRPAKDEIIRSTVSVKACLMSKSDASDETEDSLQGTSKVLSGSDTTTKAKALIKPASQKIIECTASDKSYLISKSDASDQGVSFQSSSKEMTLASFPTANNTLINEKPSENGNSPLVLPYASTTLESLPAKRGRTESIETLNIRTQDEIEGLLKAFGAIVSSLKSLRCKPLYEKIYFIGDKSSVNIAPSSLPFDSEFMHFDLNKPLFLNDAKSILNKIGSVKSKACFLIFSSSIIAKKSLISTVKCSKDSCNSKIETMLLQMTDENSIINCLQMIKEFIKRISEDVPTFILPLSPSVIFLCEENCKADHNFVHMFPSFPHKNAYLCIGQEETWDASFTFLRSQWSSLLKETHKSCISFPLIKEYIDLSREIYAIGSTTKDFFAFWNEKRVWKAFIELLTLVLGLSLKEAGETKMMDPLSFLSSQHNSSLISSDKNFSHCDEKEDSDKNASDKEAVAIVAKDRKKENIEISVQFNNFVPNPATSESRDDAREKDEETSTFSNRKSDLHLESEPPKSSKTNIELERCKRSKNETSSIEKQNEEMREKNVEFLDKLTSLCMTITDGSKSPAFEKIFFVGDKSLFTSLLSLPYKAEFIDYDLTNLFGNEASDLIKRIGHFKKGKATCFLLFSPLLVASKRSSNINCTLDSCHDAIESSHIKSGVYLSSFVENCIFTINQLIEGLSKVLPTFIFPLFPIVIFFAKAPLDHTLGHLFKKGRNMNSLLVVDNKDAWDSTLLELNEHWKTLLMKNHKQYASFDLAKEYIGANRKIYAVGSTLKDFNTAWKERNIWRALVANILKVLVKRPQLFQKSKVQMKKISADAHSPVSSSKVTLDTRQLSRNPVGEKELQSESRKHNFPKLYSSPLEQSSKSSYRSKPNNPSESYQYSRTRDRPKARSLSPCNSHSQCKRPEARHSSSSPYKKLSYDYSRRRRRRANSRSRSRSLSPKGRKLFPKTQKDRLHSLRTRSEKEVKLNEKLDLRAKRSCSPHSKIEQKSFSPQNSKRICSKQRAYSPKRTQPSKNRLENFVPHSSKRTRSPSPLGTHSRKSQKSSHCKEHDKSMSPESANSNLCSKSPSQAQSQSKSQVPYRPYKESHISSHQKFPEGHPQPEKELSKERGSEKISISKSLNYEPLRIQDEQDLVDYCEEICEIDDFLENSQDSEDSDVNSRYRDPLQEASFQETFSIEGALDLLEQLKEKMGLLSHAISALVQECKKRETDTPAILSYLQRPENELLFKMILDNLNFHLQSASSFTLPIYKTAFEWTSKLLEISKVDQGTYGLDLLWFANVVAKKKS